jgi:NADPH:quinone reductase-like Zn-dependent oxidoreductase/SAM-dependent methyltransferase/NADP-dependent 3-hydroxy acid dehydrogenase YdfG/acyl carrier protein
MEGLGEAGHRVYVEIGPGTTLLGLGRQCLEGREGVWLASLRRGESDWRQMLNSLGTLYEQGAEVNWAGFDQPYDRRRVSLPTYPFERQRYWLDAKAGKAAAAVKRTGGRHPLLGGRTEVAGSPGMSIWETDISIEKVPYLADHCVQGSIVVPMAAYLEMIAAAAIELSRPAACEVTIGEPLLLSGTEPKTVQVVARDGSIEIYSRQAGSWRLHATSRAAMLPATGAPEGLDSLRQRLRDEFSTHAFHDLLRNRGLDFGPAFQNVRRIWSGAGEALAQISASDCLVDEAEYGRAHPALLDGCLQVLAAAIGTADGALYLPVGVESCAITTRLTGELWSHAVIRTEPGSTQAMRRADISIFSPDGALLGQLNGVTLRQADAAALDRRPASADGDCLFLPEWKLLPDASPAGILARVPSQVESLRSNSRLERHDALEPQLDALCSAYICEALSAMGWPLAAGESIAEAALAARCGIVGAQRKLFQRLLAILAEDGILERTGAEDWLVLRVAPSQDTEALVAGLRRAYPDYDTELGLTERCGLELAAVLRGQSDPLQLLFPGGSIAELEKLYAGSPSATVINAQVRYAIADAIAGLSAGRTLRLLEIGAGTGGTTKAVVPALPADRTEYTFTDISPLFLDRAARTFSDHPAVRYQALDIERDPEEQGFAAGSYDIVLAANVLHATADIRQSLDHARRLLAPGGLLFLIEITRPERWIDLTFGMTEGWWRFHDRDLRAAYPLLSPAQWRGVLEAGGFDMTAELDTPGCTSTILAARRALEDAGASSGPGSWLILADEGGIGARLAASLKERGKSCVMAFSRGEMEECFRAPRTWEGVVYLWALDAPGSDDLTVESLNRSQNSTCGGLLDLIQGLARNASGDPPRLWLVTRGAQEVSGRQDSVAVSQAPLWGMARSIVREHPEFRCVAIDLDSGAGAGSAELLFDEIWRRAEQHLALRGNSRFSFQLDPKGAEPGASGPLRLAIATRGVLDNLELQPAQRRRPGPGEVEIAVAAAGLVFRDVLNALGLYPGDAGPLGGECGGKIVSVGAGVDGLREGDEVIAMAPGAHDGFVLADSRLVIRRPARCTCEEAVTLLSSFLTASHALEDLAAIRPGDRVLIHAGAGGVGLAAIQIALRAGAEIFATAGSDRKRSYLRSLGVHHLFDSRTLNFAREILELTGGRGVDVALNSLADDFVGATFSALAPGGRFVEIGKRGIWTAEQVRALGKAISYHVVDLGATSIAEPERISALLTRIVRRVERGEWTPLPYQSFPFGGAMEAYRFMAQGKHIGKIVLCQEAPEVRILADATYLVAGGLGGLGVEVAGRLVERGARHVVLTARGDCPERARPAIEKMQAAGAQILVRRADVSRREEMAELFREIARDLPPLRGVIHAAGTLADGALLQQSWERFESVMASKVSGTWILHELTAHLPLDFFVLFSSIASVLGAPGQANHAAANAFEDALARDRRLHGLPAVSINWGAWSEVGSATGDDLSKRRTAMGIGSFSTAQGLALFERILNAKYSQVVAAQMKRAVVERPVASATAGTVQSPRRGEPELLQQLEAAAEAGRSTILGKYIQGVAKRVLGFPAEREIDPRQPLNELGLDSLMAVEFRNIMAAALKRPLPATMLFSYPAIEDIARYAAAELFGAPAVVAAAAPAGRAKLLDRIEDLSDAEVDELLAGRIEGAV